jgi:hypothetical protein
MLVNLWFYGRGFNKKLNKKAADTVLLALNFLIKEQPVATPLSAVPESFSPFGGLFG